MADAVRAVTRTDLKTNVPACILGWSGLDSDDSGAPAQLADYPDKTVTITGTFGAGGTIKIQGSNNGTDWFTVTDAQGNAIEKTAASMELITENPLYIRPLVTGGDGTTALAVQILCLRSTR